MVVFKDFASTKSNIFLLEHSNILKKTKQFFWASCRLLIIIIKFFFGLLQVKPYFCWWQTNASKLSGRHQRSDWRSTQWPTYRSAHWFSKWSGGRPSSRIRTSAAVAAFRSRWHSSVRNRSFSCAKLVG